MPVVVFMVGAVSMARATVLLPLQVEDMARLAPLVVIGEVNEVRCEWNEKHTKIYTTATITVKEVLKGRKALSTVTVRTIGGRLDDVVAEPAGMPRFSVGERVAVFLEPRKDGKGYNTVGMYLGKYQIAKDPSTGREIAVRPSGGAGVAFAGEKHMVDRQQVMELDELRRLVRLAGGE
ncbi:MAG: hypothetical protein D6806_13645 [Deltaproteobacteria bacterium]|nr:MAG: hypothetical protein D6806_13645 [Deltaproteobacteria bacterium]